MSTESYVTLLHVLCKKCITLRNFMKEHIEYMCVVCKSFQEVTFMSSAFLAP